MGKGTFISLLIPFVVNSVDGQNCFLDFQDLHSSSMALSALNNLPLGTCHLRVDYAKKRMGEGVFSRIHSYFGIILFLIFCVSFLPSVFSFSYFLCFLC
jgi:hypothetical protein